MTTLAEAIRGVFGSPTGRTRPTGQTDSGFFSQGTITAVDGVGGLTIEVHGRSVAAKPATDEPFKVGMRVWASDSPEGWVVIGGVR